MALFKTKRYKLRNDNTPSRFRWPRDLKCRYIDEWDEDYPSCKAGGRYYPKTDLEEEGTVFEKYCSKEYRQCDRYKDQQAIDRSPFVSTQI